MKLKVIVFTLAVFFAGVAVYAADDPNIGTWKLNEAKSKFAAGASKNNTVVVEAAGDMIKVTVDGTDGSGNPAHNEWTGKFDGKYYAVTGNPTSDMRSYKKLNSRTWSLAEKNGGKVGVTGRITVSRDGKARTVTTTSKNAKGKWIHNTAVYDKQ
jgi:hypothetical protein